MSLTSQLKNKESPVKQFLSESASRLSLAGGRGNAGKDIALEFNFDDITTRNIVIPIPDSVDNRRTHSSLIGTAFDYRTRMEIEEFEILETTAYEGLSRLDLFSDYFEGGSHMVKILIDAINISIDSSNSGNQSSLDELAIILAWCESIYRAGIPRIIRGSLGDRLRQSENGTQLLATIDSLSISDLSSLREASQPQIDIWCSEIESGSSFEHNPTFPGSYLVEGADADWAIDDTLIECKTMAKITNTHIRDMLFQLLGYTLLDFDDCFGIRKVAIWLPRYQILKTWSLDQILGQSAEQKLPELRYDFQQLLCR